MSKDIINEADELQEDPVLDETEDTLEPEVASTEAEVENTLSEEPEGETNEEKPSAFREVVSWCLTFVFAIAVALILNIRRMVRNVKQGKSIDGCDGNCSHCSHCH